jgi:hypothetical protein
MAGRAAGGGPDGGLVAVLLTNRVHTVPGDPLDLGPGGTASWPVRPVDGPPPG